MELIITKLQRVQINDIKNKRVNYKIEENNTCVPRYSLL